VKDTEEHDAAISDIGKGLSNKWKPFLKKSGTLVESALLSQNESVPYYIWFHVDRITTSSEESRILIHIHFYTKPSSKPPKLMVDRQKSNVTLEWFWQKLSVLDVQSDTPVLVDAELRLTNWKRRTVQLPLSAPLSDTNTRSSLEVCGIEYKAKDSTGRVQGFRWSAPQGDQIKVWLSYVSPAQLNRSNIWEEEKVVCVQHLKSLL
jgi:hypothetical protein